MPTTRRVIRANSSWPCENLGSPRWRLRIAVVATWVLMLAAGCSSSDSTLPAKGSANTAANTAATTSATTSTTTSALPPASVPQVSQVLEVDTGEYTFKFPDLQPSELHAGWTEIRLTNVGKEAHQVMFAQLKPGADLAELAQQAGSDSSGSAALGFVNMLGGVSYIAPGQQTRSLVNLPEGLVMAMCYVPNDQGVAHALLGMSTMLTVGPAQKLGAASPADSNNAVVVGTIRFGADGYEVPEKITKGWYHVLNSDTENPGVGLHELSILRLQTNATLSKSEINSVVTDLAENKTPAVGITALGGYGALQPGYEGYVWLDLSAGQYLFVDFMPDDSDPTPHLAKGYFDHIEI